MSRRYRKPPVREAVCEFKFRPGSTWDMAQPGLIFNELKHEFPRRIQSPAVQPPISFSTPNPEVEGQINEIVRQDFSVQQGLRFWREGSDDGLIVVAPNRLAVSHYRPYPSWEKFLPIIEQAFDAYREVAQPEGLQRIGLRYINDIDFQADTVELEDYFEMYPHLGGTLLQDFGPMLMVIDFPFAEGRDGMRVQMGTQPGGDEGNVVIRLDLDYSLREPDLLEIAKTSEWLQNAHAEVSEMFEGCLKDRVRLLFEEED